MNHDLIRAGEPEVESLMVREGASSQEVTMINGKKRVMCLVWRKLVDLETDYS